MQAAAQKWIDSSISKTINCPEDISFDDFKEVYMAAWDQGCKGCTTYRPNDVTGSVLSVSEEKAPAEEPAQMHVDGDGAEVVYMSEPLDRPQELDGATYKLKWPDSEHAIYITVNDLVIAGHRRPFEVVCCGRAEGGVRSARRGLDAGQICPVNLGGHRWRNREAYGGHWFPCWRGHGAEG